MTGTILLVEDDQVLLQFLKTRLEREGFRVVTAAGGEEALRAASREVPDAVVMDLVLSDLDGPTVCRRLRSHPATARLPILVLGGKGDQVDRIVGPDLAAEDFITRPYNDQELIARLKALLVRTTLSPPGRVLRAGAIEVDLDRYRVIVGGRQVNLTSKEFDLLKALMEARGRVLRREFLLEKVWGYGRDAGIASRTIDVHIRRLREKLGAAEARIRTVRNVGYCLDVSVEQLLEAGEQGRDA